MGTFSWILVFAALLVLILFFPGLLSAYFRNWKTTIPVTIGLVIGWLFYGFWQGLDPSGYLTRYVWIFKPVVLLVSVSVFVSLSREFFKLF